MTEHAAPTGYNRLSDTSGFLDNFGPVWLDPGRKRLGLRVAQHHLNRFGKLHGSAFAAFSDLQMLLLYGFEESPVQRARTISLSVDLLGTVEEGAWLDMAVVLTKETGSMLFTDATMQVDGVTVARARAIYKKRRNP